MHNIGIVEKTVLKKTYEEGHIEWIIPDFFMTAAGRIDIDSPEFIVADVSWYMSLYVTQKSNDEFISLFVNTDDDREFPVEYNLGLKKLDGRIEQKIFGILEGNCRSSNQYRFIQFSELQRQKSVLVPQNVLTIVCSLKHEISNSTQPSDKTMPMKLIRLDKLSENFKDLFGNKETCDVTLKVKDKEHKAHRCVLIARSSVFTANFKYDTLERQTGVITIRDCDSDSFQKFLEYLYCGRLEELSSHSAQSLYYASDKYAVEELKAFCVEYLMQSLTVENMCEVVVFADKYEETELFSAVQEFFNKNVCAILESPEWECLLKNNYRLANKLMLQMAKMKLKA